MTSLNEPQYNDTILLLNPVTGRSDGRFTKVKRVLSSDEDNGLFEVETKLSQTLIVGATTDSRQWLEVDL